MEKKLSVLESDIIAIKELSNELKNCGVDGYEYYYKDDELRLPYFKIEKPYKKEKDGDPDSHAIFIDVEVNDNSVEYTVVGMLCHEHFNSAQMASELVKGLLNEQVCEVALVYPNMKATFFTVNEDEPIKNVKKINSNAKTITERLFGGANFPNVHIHSLFAESYTNNLLCDYKEQLKISGVKAYLVSSVVGYHPEY